METDMFNKNEYNLYEVLYTSLSNKNRIKTYKIATIK